MDRSLEQFPVVIALPVLWGDMDAFGHVNNTRHIQWFESSRVAYLERAGLRELMTAHKLGPILAAISCQYRRQLVYPDTVHVAARVVRMGRTSMTLEHQIHSEARQELSAEGESVVVLFDYQRQRPVRIDQALRQAIEQFEGRTF